jgi:hypothetical protein
MEMLTGTVLREVFYVSIKIKFEFSVFNKKYSEQGSVYFIRHIRRVSKINIFCDVHELAKLID